MIFLNIIKYIIYYIKFLFVKIFYLNNILKLFIGRKLLAATANVTLLIKPKPTLTSTFIFYFLYSKYNSFFYPNLRFILRLLNYCTVFP